LLEKGFDVVVLDAFLAVLPLIVATANWCSIS
jgi:hypothetical protein